MSICRCILQLLVVGLFSLSVPPVQAAQVLRGPFPAEIITVIDGDTIHARIIIWLDQLVTVRVRLEGVDTPEINGKCEQERALAQKAKAFSETWLAKARAYSDRQTNKKNMTDKIIDEAIVLVNVQYGKYAGRVVADIQNRRGETLSAALIAAGLAQPYGTPAKWCA